MANALQRRRGGRGKVRNDPRLPYGLPGVNKKGKIPETATISGFLFRQLPERSGPCRIRHVLAGIVGGRRRGKGQEEADRSRPRGHHDGDPFRLLLHAHGAMRIVVPGQGKRPDDYHTKVLMIDARNVYEGDTQDYDFTPEQQKNLSAIVWLYRGQFGRFVALIAEHFDRMILEASKAVRPLKGLCCRTHKKRSHSIRTATSQRSRCEYRGT